MRAATETTEGGRCKQGGLAPGNGVMYGDRRGDLFDDEGGRNKTQPRTKTGQTLRCGRGSVRGMEASMVLVVLTVER